jgi:hypothetical protein
VTRTSPNTGPRQRRVPGPMDPFPPTGTPEFDPYAAPEAPLQREAAPEGAEDLFRAESICRAHRSHEALVQSIGSLHYLSVIFGMLGFVAILVGVLSTIGPGKGGLEGARLIGMLVYLLAATALNLAMTIGLTKLKPWRRGPKSCSRVSR